MSPIRKSISVIHHRRDRLTQETGFGIVTYRPGGVFGPRLQEHYQLVVVHSGEMTVRVDGAEHSVGISQGILLGPGCLETFRFSETTDTTHSWCQLPPHLLPTFFAFPADCIGRPGPCSSWLLGFMKRCGRWPEEGPEADVLQIQVAKVLQVVWQFCQGGLLHASPSRTPDVLAQAIRVISSRLADPISLDELARASGVSKGYLVRLAHRHWGMTPMEKVWLLRLQEAARLLGQTGLGIGEVAYLTGFANPYHFSRRFKAHFGMQPSLWRQTKWGHPSDLSKQSEE